MGRESTPLDSISRLDFISGHGPRHDGETWRQHAIARRRAAQREWHAARSRMEHTAEALTVAIGHASRSVAALRVRLDEARRGEREARSRYQRVAQDTSTHLSRLLSRGDRPA